MTGARRFALALIACAASRAGSAAGPPPLADVVLDPNAAANISDNGELLVHYPPPIVEGDAVYTEVKAGDYTGLATWETQTWGVRRWDWKDGALVERWTWWSDWKPVPFAEFGTNPGGAGPLWEPVFQPASSGGLLYVPGAGGSIDAIREEDGVRISRIRPFALPGVFVTGPVVASGQGVYGTLVALDPTHPWDADVRGSWVVRIAPGGAVTTASFAGLLPGAPAADAPCEISFPGSDLPFPPPGLPAPTIPCGSPRAVVGAGAAVAADGTVYLAARSHFDGRYGWLVALGPDLSRRWASSLRGRLSDGCGVAVPPTGGPGGCRAGATRGVDPATGGAPAAIVDDSSSASPVPTPDGGVLYGAYTRYNFAQGHLLKFGPGGAFAAAFSFGWDTTPVVHPHDGTYSIVLKENRYDVGSYCGNQTFCPTPRSTAYPDDPVAYFLTRLDPSLAVESRYRNVTSESCRRLPDGSIACSDAHREGFEFCVSIVAVDDAGVAYANSEDGYLYAVEPGGALRGRVFLESAEGAAYTPVVVASGVVYTQNLGHLIAVPASAIRDCPPAAPPGDARGPVCPAPEAPRAPIVTRSR